MTLIINARGSYRKSGGEGREIEGRKVGTFGLGFQKKIDTYYLKNRRGQRMGVMRKKIGRQVAKGKKRTTWGHRPRRKKESS